MIIEAVFCFHLLSPSARRCQTPQRTHLINLDNIPDESCTTKKQDQIRWPNHSFDTSDGVEKRTIKYLKTFLCAACRSLVEAWRWVGGIVPDGETKEKKAGWLEHVQALLENDIKVLWLSIFVALLSSPLPTDPDDHRPHSWNRHTRYWPSVLISRGNLRESKRFLSL